MRVVHHIGICGIVAYVILINTLKIKRIIQKRKRAYKKNQKIKIYTENWQTYAFRYIRQSD